MKKITLNLEDLTVESFDTLPQQSEGRQGTVYGYTPPLVSCGETQCDPTCGTCDPSCNGTCATCTCDESCGGTCTCGASCGGTCDYSCVSCVPTCFNWPGCETTTLP